MCSYKNTLLAENLYYVLVYPIYLQLLFHCRCCCRCCGATAVVVIVTVANRLGFVCLAFVWSSFRIRQWGWFLWWTCNRGTLMPPTRGMWRGLWASIKLDNLLRLLLCFYFHCASKCCMRVSCMLPICVRLRVCECVCVCLLLISRQQAKVKACCGCPAIIQNALKLLHRIVFVDVERAVC